MADAFDFLADFLVIDLSTHMAGAVLGRCLADRGARVVKVRNPNRPDASESLGEAAYAALHRGKEFLELDIDTAPGRSAFEDLVRKADGLIENLRPEAREKLRLRWEDLSAINPRLCVAGVASDDESRAGYDLNFQARAGALAPRGDFPLAPWASLVGAYDGALALALALVEAKATGRGRRVAVDLTASLRGAVGFLRAPEKGPGLRLLGGDFPCYAVYACADGRRVAVAACEPKFWKSLCGVLGVSLTDADAFASGADGERVRKILSDAFAAKPWSDWAGAFLAADACVDAF